MAIREREIKVTVLGDSSRGQRALAELNDSADRTDAKFDGLGGKLASFGKVAALGMAGAAVGVGVFIKSAVQAAEESRKVMAQTEAVIKSTGGAANVSAKDVDSLASSLSAMSGVDDELIASGQNLLLTFTNIRNETGKGNDVFNQATKSALNMSVALGTDLSSASMLVGKALNDPIGGMTALTRAGIQFTDSQKEQIRVLVESGDTLGAQKIILKELEVQFGGSAAAAASPMERLKVVLGNLQEEIGARFLPVVATVATFLADNLPAALDKAAAFFGPLIERVMGFINAVSVHWPVIQSTISDVLASVQEVIAAFVDLALAIWNQFGEQITSYVREAWDAAQQIIGGALEVIQGIIATVTAIIQGDWSAAWEGIQQILSGAWSVINGIIDQAMNIMQSIVSIGMEILWNVISSAFEGIIGLVASIPGRIIGALGDLAGMLWDSGWGMMEAFANGIRAGLGNVLSAVRSVLSRARDLLPFSDAKTGPLKDLTLSGRRMQEAFATGIRSSSAITDAFAAVLPALDGGGRLGSMSLANAGRGGAASTATSTSKTSNVTINMGGRVDPLHLAREIAWAMG